MSKAQFGRDLDNLLLTRGAGFHVGPRQPALMQSTSGPRATRFNLNLPVRFFTTDGLFSGQTVNISESGVSVIFERPVDIWVLGDLSFHLEDRELTLAAKVARLDGRVAGMAFKVHSDADREVISGLVAFAQLQASL